jgi:hypothetical protein
MRVILLFTDKPLRKFYIFPCEMNVWGIDKVVKLCFIMVRNGEKLGKRGNNGN